MKKIILLATFLAVALQINAQEQRSSYFMETSMFRHQTNPALLTNAYVALPLVGNISVKTTGTNGLASFVYPLNDGTNRLATFMSPTVGSNEFLDKIGDKVSLNAHLNTNLFSVAFRGFKGVNVIEMNLRSNSSVQLPGDLFILMKTTGAKQQYDFSKLGIKTENYAEIAFGHSHKINENLTIGGKLKALIGLAYANLEVNKFDLTMNGDKWAVDGDASLTMASVGNPSFEYEQNPDPKTYDATRGKKVNGVNFGDFSASPAGFGGAIDLGAVYQMPMVDGLSLSASLTDLGYISWKDAQKTTSKGSWSFEGFDEIAVNDSNSDKTLEKQAEKLGDDFVKMFSPYSDGSKESKSQFLGATLSVGAEYAMPFYKKLRAGLLISHRFGGVHRFTQETLSLNVRPVKWFETSVNGTYGTNGLAFGGMISFFTTGFNFYIGSDAFFGKLSKQYIPLNNLNASINMGITFPFGGGKSAVQPSNDEIVID